VRNAFSEWNEVISDIIVEGDKVVTRYVSTGVHIRPFVGIEPTGRTVRVDEISIYPLQNSTVLEQWFLTNDISFARQLGRI
jgi:predicted ester cyclase